MKSKDITSLLSKGPGQAPLIISGPCSAETEEQVLETGRRLQKAGCVDIFRAGIWKPRTRPGSFEGVGVAGLPWLQRLKSETGMPVAVEIANAKQVTAALQCGVDILWIGARTTVNPFSVQEIADALKGVKVPVLIKNPLNPDIDLWTGAVERIAASGITQIALVHRGFSEYGNTTYRNVPMWPLALEMARRHPELLMICDPSHICGNRKLLPLVAGKALELGFGGLMMETHCDPANAWSDAQQQISPEALKHLLEELTLKHEAIGIADPEAAGLKQEMDALDEALLQLLKQRARVAGRMEATVETDHYPF